MGIATSGFHKSLHSGTDPGDAVYHTRRMVDDVKGGCQVSTPEALLDQAAAVLEDPTAHSNRGACWIARAALESAVDELLEDRNCSATDASMRSKLTLLQATSDPDDDLAGRAEYAWSRLSQACHHHAFELSPTASEVRQLMGIVAALVSCSAPASDLLERA